MTHEGRVLLAVVASLLLPVAGGAADARPAAKKLEAAQIVERHVAARGGTRAWHGVETMVLSGKMDVGYGDSVERSARYVGDPLARKTRGSRQPAAGRGEARAQVQVPFVLEQKRPGKSRVEIEFAGKTAVQVFDGTRGWVLRPFLDRDDWQPFTEEQARSYQGAGAFEDPLLEAAAKGTKVALESMEKVDGHDAYRLKLTRKDGGVQHVWVDAKSFLDVKVEGTPRRMDGKMRTVWVTQRDFRPVQGLMVPFVLETAVDGYADTHQVLVEKVALNPSLDDARFTRPRS